ncbi:MAG: response regulator [Acidobacteriaceae bacterium]|nr:response regulator [Acidobacteriaceae bacterium]
MPKPCIYHIEDNDADRTMLAFALDAQPDTLDMYCARDGEEAIRILGEVARGTRSRPDVIVLDLNLPKVPGVEVLSAIRRDPDLCDALVVVLTSSDAPEERSQTEALGISEYLRKPMDVDGFLAIGEQLLRMARCVQVSREAVAGQRGA